MPTVIVEDGTGLPNANSYVDPAGAFAADYFAAHLYADLWNEADETKREQAVISATRAIDTYFEFKGFVLKANQALEWPRVRVVWRGHTVDGVPVRVQQATLEQSLAMMAGDRLGATTSEDQLTKLGLGEGALDLEFAATAQGQVTALLDNVAALLAPFGTRNDKGTGMVKVYRA